ncbi:MAG: hypothetical protein V7677_19835, partial [Motiliproteus sp.]
WKLCLVEASDSHPLIPLNAAMLGYTGGGINWLQRKTYRRNIAKKHRSKYDDAVKHEYRSVLQQTSLHKAKK